MFNLFFDAVIRDSHCWLSAAYRVFSISFQFCLDQLNKVVTYRKYIFNGFELRHPTIYPEYVFILDNLGR